MVGGAIPEVRNDTGELPILHEPSRPSRIISWAEDWPGPSRAAVWPTVRCCGPRPTCWPGEEQAKARVRPALPCLRRVRRRPGPGEPRCARPAAPARRRPGPGRATRIQPRPPLRSHRQPPLPVPPFRIWAGPAPEAPLGTPQPSVGLHARRGWLRKWLPQAVASVEPAPSERPHPLRAASLRGGPGRI